MAWEVEMTVRLRVEAPSESDAVEVVEDYFGECDFGGVEVVETDLNDISESG